ncbi:hypothetical protein PACTADRAFT_48179 [Pachysolen tannophilus NRRL Y-2460]|uniref:ENTH domain-containing protein n=1 Tax=Pachysolen tannophilus NRRL Y-2460 TaxID=669874 RepID=A0A1E4U342_PACTA|nr:hypothetical protein PACTADRAFT_48179 [Pachysolen tannophilus NRRL Y-2460]
MTENRFLKSFQKISSSQVENKVRNITNNDSWGPSGKDLNEIAKLTFQNNKLNEIIKALNKRLSLINSDGDSNRNYRRILKTLTVIQFCVQVGSIEFARYYQENIYFFDKILTGIRANLNTKNDQNYQNIKNRAKYLLILLTDEAKLSEKRENFHKLRSTMAIPGLKVEKSNSNDDEDGINKKSFQSLRYSLDSASNNYNENINEEIVLPNLSSNKIASKSLDLNRLKYYKNNKDQSFELNSNSHSLPTSTETKRENLTTLTEEVEIEEDGNEIAFKKPYTITKTNLSSGNRTRRILDDRNPFKGMV